MSTHASEGATLVEIIRRLEDDGYGGQLVAEEGGRLRCLSCRTSSPASEARVDVLRRAEGASDPADMVAVAAVRCPRCGAKGTTTLKYGPESSLEEAEVLTRLEAARHHPEP